MGASLGRRASNTRSRANWQTPGEDIDLADIVADLEFAAHYHALRDLLYYTYNAPGSMAWTFDAGKVEIRYADVSLPRQFFVSSNNWFLESITAFSDNEREQRIEELLLGRLCSR